MVAVNRRTELAQNLAAVRARIDAVAAPGQQVQLLPVTKFHPASDLELLVELGAADVAENREQEARDKAAAVPVARIHMIGQIQSKKANSVARWAGAVHSIDSEKLVAGLSRGMGLAISRGDRAAGQLPCFIQLSADGDTSRGGAEEGDVDKLADAVLAAEHLELAGIMCVPPLDSDPAEVFTRARALTDRLAARVERKLLLSAGMSGDLETAITAGSDIVRVGTAILGERPLR